MVGSKPKGISGWLNVTWRDFSRMIRVEAADARGVCECVTCGHRAHWSSGIIQAGHFLNYRYPMSPVRFEETNVYPQCRHCNTVGRVATYVPRASHVQETVKMRFLTHVIKLHGMEEVERLELLRNTGRVDYTEEKLMLMRAEYKRRADKAIKEKGL